MQTVKTWVREVFFWWVAFMNFAVPKRHQLLLHSLPDVEDQQVAMLRWLACHPSVQVQVVHVVIGSEDAARRNLRKLVGPFIDGIRIYRKTRPIAIWSYWRSRFVVFTHGLYGYCPRPRSQTVINIWHGMPTKGIWNAISGSRVPTCDYLLSTSPKFTEVLAAVSGFPPSKILPLGLPRNDTLFQRRPAQDAFVQEQRQNHEKLVIFLPTFRQTAAGYQMSDGQESDSPLVMSPDEVPLLQRLLRSTRTRLLVKPHPLSVHYGREFSVDENIEIISDDWLMRRGVTLYEALAVADVVVTDTSSVYVDLLCIRKPCLFYFPDVEAYAARRKFLLEPIEDWISGTLHRDGRSLCSELESVLSGTARGTVNPARIALLNTQEAPQATAAVMQLLGLDVREAVRE